MTYVFFSLYREIDGVVYPGDVKEKEKARKQFEAAKKKGQSAGHVSQRYNYVNLKAWSDWVTDLIWRKNRQNLQNLI